MKSRKNSKQSKTQWQEIGFLNKTKRPDILHGKIKIANMELRIVGFVKGQKMKKNDNDYDIRILLPIENETDNLF